MEKSLKVRKPKNHDVYIPLETWPWLPHLYYHPQTLYPVFLAPEICQTKIDKNSLR